MHASYRTAIDICLIIPKIFHFLLSKHLVVDRLVLPQKLSTTKIFFVAIWSQEICCRKINLQPNTRLVAERSEEIFITIG